MRIKTLSLVALTVTTLASTNLFAQSSGQGGSGSSGFQVGGNTVTATTSSNALSFVVPVGAVGSITVSSASGGTITISVGSPGSSAITQLGGTFGGPGTYVLTDSAGNTITVVVGEDGNVASISEGDTSNS
ncbi:hypothetical protein ED208_14405 [Stagnimonas aquatica]|uniref:Uncharacterized protein n=1 Tax=Stagnimonas aquatica TaxID=2689987 RepID=A0A3N0V5E2_9GAMM|nr:hypothetical protein [Stagnimonas aquatica]ROH87895.1 hypothetical protein ED208_14405 [Stagnimonas aquatica]